MRTPLPTDFSPPSGEFGIVAVLLDEPTQVLHGSFPVSGLANRIDDSLQMPQLPTIPGYELLNQIGAGGMGVVYRAKHIELDRIVAIKVLTRESMLDRESHERFHREATAVAKVQHPNIIQVFDVGTYPVRGGSIIRQPYLSLEYVGGGSLVRQTRNPQPLKQVAKMMETIARAVHAAHEQGVIHRDLKPGNVLLTPDGTPKIADFGLAKSIDTYQGSDGEALTQVGVLIGTPEYMSPEQVQGLDNRPSVDIYALGVILYELLTARVPFKGETSAETLVLLQSQEPLSPRKLQPNLPADLETICLKCLQKNPAKRYTTALEMAEDLARWQSGDAITARPVSSAERVYRWTIRNPMMAVLIGLVLFGTLGSFGALLIAYGIAENKSKLAKQAEENAQNKVLEQQYELYRASCLAASAGLQIHNITMVKQALDDAPEEFRGWEWNYYQSQLDRSNEVLHEAHVHEVCRRVNGAEYFSLGRWNHDLLFLNLRTRKVIRREALDEKTTHVSRDFGAKTYAVRTNRGPIEIRSLETGLPVARIDCGSGVFEQIVVSADDRTLMVQCKHDIQFWDIEAGKLKHRYVNRNESMTLSSNNRDLSKLLLVLIKEDADKKIIGFRQALLHVEDMKVITLAETLHHMTHTYFNHDGTRLFTSCMHPNLHVRLWDTATGQVVAKLEGHTNQIRAARFSPDDKTLVTGSMDHNIFVWDGVTGAQRQRIQAHHDWVTDIDFSPDGTKFAASSRDQSISLWDISSGREIARLLGHDALVNNVAFSPDSTHLVSTTDSGKILSWDITEIEKENGLNGHTNFVYAVDYHPTLPQAITCSWDGSVCIWDVKKGERIDRNVLGKDIIVAHVRYHPDGTKYVTVSRLRNKMVATVTLFDLKTHRPLGEWTIHCEIWRDGRGGFSPDGKSFVVGGFELHTIDLTDTKKAPQLWLGRNATVHDAAYTRDGKYMIAAIEHGSMPSCLRVWETATAREIHLPIPELNHQQFNTLAIHPKDGLLYAATIRGKILVIDLETRKLVTSFENGVCAYDMVFTPDGTRLAMACSNKLIRLWETKHHKVIAELKGHGDYVHALVFSKCGDILVSGSGDSTVRFWKSKQNP
jgi:eukaryotic-like serine/threonine-protein kinase